MPASKPKVSRRKRTAPARANVAAGLTTELTQLEDAQLVRRLPEEELAYLFKHAMTQEAAYESLLHKSRREIHHAVAEAYEALYTDHLDENEALLARHFELAEEPQRALTYLSRAAEWARRAGAHREEIELLTRALAIAEQIGKAELIPELHLRRGQALMQITDAPAATREYERALAALPPSADAQRAQVLLELATSAMWSWDAERSKQHTQVALALAERAGRDDLVTSAMIALASLDVSDGNTRGGLDRYAQVFARRFDEHNQAYVRGMEYAGLTLYWTGQYEQAIARNREAARMAREISDSITVVRALANLGMALMGAGEYGDALEAFEEASDYARKHGVETWHARTLVMKGGLHLELFDYAGAERVAEEARDQARKAKFPPALVSTDIDLLFNYARTGHVAKAEELVPQIAAELPKTYGSHRWLWETRFIQARAELALARGQGDAARELATESLHAHRRTGRIKYQICALLTRADAQLRAGQWHATRDDLNAALDLARQIGDPVLILRSGGALLKLEGDDALVAELRAAADRVLRSLPSGDLRDRFHAIASEWV